MPKVTLILTSEDVKALLLGLNLVRDMGEDNIAQEHGLAYVKRLLYLTYIFTACHFSHLVEAD